METTAVTNLPALTDVTNGIDVFFYDVAQANQNQATWWNSVSDFCNNIIDAVKSCGIYINYIIDVADVFIQENTIPVCIGTGITIALTFTIIDFYRGR